MQALLGMHVFTGNDYVSSFFKKRKEMCWKLFRKYEKFERCLINLEMESSLSSSLFSTLQEFVSMLHGTKLESVNEDRYAIFEKTLYLSRSDSLKESLHVHSKRANQWHICVERLLTPL